MRHVKVTKLSGPALRAAAVMLGCAMGAIPAAADPPEAGLWYDDTGKGAVKIEICTPTTLCGKIIWLKEPMNAQGEPKTDKYNPEPSLRGRSICGLPILGDLVQMSEGGFDNGWVYDPKEGKSYDVALDLVAPDKLKVTGYKGMRFLGKSFIWTRAPQDLPPCSTTASVSPDAAPADPTQPPPKKSASTTGKKKPASTSASKLGATGVTPAQKVKKTERAATQQPPVASN